MNDITLNDLIPNFRVYYKNGNEVVYRTIEYIRNPDEDNPNINVALTNLPFENNDLDKENEEKQTQNKTLMIKFIGEEDEETCNVNVNNNDVNILVMKDDFLFYETELYKKNTQKKTGGKKRRLSRKKRRLSRKKRKLSRKRK